MDFPCANCDKSATPLTEDIAVENGTLHLYICPKCKVRTPYLFTSKARAKLLHRLEQVQADYNRSPTFEAWDKVLETQKLLASTGQTLNPDDVSVFERYGVSRFATN